MTLKNIAARRKISTPTRPKIGSLHVGDKNKQVLEQELFSLSNAEPPVWATRYKAWDAAWKATLGEYQKAYPTSNWLVAWYAARKPIRK